MEIFGIAITFFSLVIAVQTWQNGKFMKQEMKDTKELLAKMDEHLAKMDEHLVKMDEQAELRHKEIVELLKKGFGEVLSKLK